QRVQVDDRGSTALSVPTLVRVGLPARLEARLATSLLTIDSEGVRRPDLTVGLKAQLVESRRVALGLLGEMRFDFGAQTDAPREARLGLLGDVALLRWLTLRTNASLLYLTGVTQSRYAFGYAGELASLITRSWLFFVGSSGLVADGTAVSLEAGTTLS